MASQYSDPPAPYTEVKTTGGSNASPRLNAYVDPNLTKRNAVETAAASDLPPKSSSTTLGGIRPVYANDQDTELDNDAAATANAAVEPPPHAPNKMAGSTRNGQFRSRDPYASDGMVGQDYLKNQGAS